jgi:putative endonuclease
MGSDHLVTGRQGEELAAHYLEELGMVIVETNFRTPYAEIDVIAKDKDVLCFIEVKTRTSMSKALPKQAVNHKKQQKIIMGGQIYLKKKHLFNVRLRFDVVEIILTSPPRINHIKHAFQAG